MREAVRSQLVQIPNFARSSAGWHGLRNAYREPERLGVDRWLAMIAAWHTHRGAACIANAGTALTVDVIDAQGQHLGGIIAAGRAEQQSAILGPPRFDVRTTPAAAGKGLGTQPSHIVRQAPQPPSPTANQRQR